MIPMFKPYLPAYMLKYAHDAIDSTWVSSIGRYISLSQEKLQEISGEKYVLLVNNGTSAVHLVAKAIRFKYPFIKNIVVPNNVYIAAWNGFLFDKDFCLTPIDSDIDTWNFNIKKIINPSAILCVHNLGNIIDVTSLINKFTNSIIVEDNCEGLFGEYNGYQSGTKSFCSAMSFYANKNITSGEGGAFYTNDKDTFDFINKTYNHGRTDIKFIHDVIGHNYRMTNVQAALLYGQLLHIEEIKERKRIIFDRYEKNLSGCDGVLLQKKEKNTKHSNFLMGIRILNNDSYNRAEFFLNSRGIEIRPMFYPISSHPYLRDFLSEETNSLILSRECFIVPSYTSISIEEIDYISENIKEYSKKYV